MNNFQAVYYRDGQGRQPVFDFMDALPDAELGSIQEVIAMLNDLSDRRPHLPHPYSSQVRDGLRELRAHHGRRHFRILYRRSERLIVVLHIFEKRTARIPEREIAIAERRFEDFKSRMDEHPRRPPRPLGRDAP
jgi:phage-related protein